MAMMLRSVVWLSLVGLAVGYVHYMDHVEDKYYNSAEEGVDPGTKSTNCSCGETNKARVVGGRETLRNEFPFMAGMVTIGGEDQTVFCGATVITHYHAVTASHCLTPFTGKKLGLLVGMHDITKLNDKTIQLLPIKKAIEHEQFDMSTLKNDIAMLVLGAKIEFNKVVSPACLPHRDRNYEGEFVKLLGWGLTTYQGVQSATLQKANLKIVPLKKCAEDNTAIDLNKQTQICATFPKRDSCDGDSGGPLLWLDHDTNRFVLVGIVSDGAICGETPGLYTNVGSYLDWIQRKIHESKRKELTCAKSG